LSTDELKDLTGIADGLLALERTIVFEGGSLRVTVRIAGRDIISIEHPGPLHQLLGNAEGKLS